MIKLGEMFMELVKNVFFNTDKLIENTPVKISYTGNLFQSGNEDVYIHYGFGSNWEELTDVKMQKTELGFQSEILLSNKDTLNFCFKTNNDEWDNNNGENYIFKIEPIPQESLQNQVTDLVVVDNTALEKKRLRKSYIWSKKAKLAIYKIITYVPKIISGNYKRRVIQ